MLSAVVIICSSAKTTIAFFQVALYLLWLLVSMKKSISDLIQPISSPDAGLRSKEPRFCSDGLLNCLEEQHDSIQASQMNWTRNHCGQMECTQSTGCMIHQIPTRPTTGEGSSAAIERPSSPQILTRLTLLNKLQDDDDDDNDDDDEGAVSLPRGAPELQSHVDADSQAGDEALVSDAKQIIGTFVTVA